MFDFLMNKMFIMSYGVYEQIGYNLNLRLLHNIT